MWIYVYNLLEGSNIQIIDDEHFIMSEKYYKLKSFDFLKDYQFEEEVEEEEGNRSIILLFQFMI